MSADVVTCFLRRRGRVLLGRRSEAVGTCSSRWDAISGYAEGDPDAAARREIEETGSVDAPTLVRTGEPLEVVDGKRTRIVHPYLFDCGPGEVTSDREFETVEWVHPTEIRRRETVPSLWKAYEAIAPTVESVRKDALHGSAYVSIRALEVLRDRAGVLADDGDGAGEWKDLAVLARDLLDARPGMAALGNRVDRTMVEADGRTADAVERSARKGIERAVRADDRAAERATDVVEGSDGVLTLSRSGTVEDALLEAAPERVVVLESRPEREGVGVAERLVRAGIDATLTLDAAAAHVVEDVDCVLVGADTVLADGSVINKVGTRTAATAAAHEGVPMYAVAAADKVAPTAEGSTLERIESEAIYGGDAPVSVDCPLFDRTPADLVAGVITEEGVLDREAIAERAAEHERLACWRERDPPEY